MSTSASTSQTRQSPQPSHLKIVDLSEPIDKSLFTTLSGLVKKSKRCVLVVGAGISVSSGLPDFRSPDGLFQLLARKYPKSIVSGKDLFDATLFKDATATKLFYNFIGEFKSLVDKADCTPTHRFINQLDESGQLLRCYTQNIDCLEERAGLATRFKVAEEAGTNNATVIKAAAKGKEHDNTGLEGRIRADDADERAATTETRARKATSATSAKQTRKPRRKLNPPRAVQLHGSLANVICTICRTKSNFGTDIQFSYKHGTPPNCPSCTELNEVRLVAGLRSKNVGVLRPDIVLYNEFHPMGEEIGAVTATDLKKRPDLLLVMGTSLKIPGVKRLIREMARSVHSRPNGRVIIVNRTPPSPLQKWSNIFDYLILGDSDEAVELLSGASTQFRFQPVTASKTESEDVGSAMRNRRLQPIVEIVSPSKTKSRRRPIVEIVSPPRPKFKQNVSADNTPKITSMFKKRKYS